MRIIFFFCSAAIYLITICGGCSTSGQKKERKARVTNNRQKRYSREYVSSSKNKTVVKMDKVNGVYHIPIYINGLKMSFIFDTGAYAVSISEKKASILYQKGLLLDKDIKGTIKFSDATGKISEGTSINLRKVVIGNRVLNNIEAQIVHNLNAPLLFGQSALEKFGEISINNKKREITFE